MSHPWFSSSINWRRLKAGKEKPPFVPDPHAVYAKGNIVISPTCLKNVTILYFCKIRNKYLVTLIKIFV